ncbi:hypothetical protein GYMLUDRAFT_57391 [Collybiopsis luxurians FD-317 M1]|uniref:Unplaced genomic scaffold GYMLUscaffold_15, whole genome shotgun sequence n=1 Tax=Collybiopsis luxurians FD-317 M1 TaxID=944289 RepID=A0A0D0C6F5_9AGAR|nr:hypothetical protein GYMLUDRAFT_57391 [Collybiopsis luxurians FD-317 M1]
MNYSSPSSSSFPLSPTSTTPSSVFPPTPTTKRSSTLVNIARRSSAKRITEALNTARMAVVGNSSRVSPVVPIENRPASQPPPSPKQGYFGPLSRLREHLPYGKNSSRRPSSPQWRKHTSYLPKTHESWRPKKNECRCLQYVLPGIFLAFEDDTLAFNAPACLPLSREEELRTHEDERFTHIVKLTSCREPGIHLGSDPHNIEVLTLGIPQRSHEGFDERMRLLSESDFDKLTPDKARQLCEEFAALQEPDKGVTVLTSKQLIAAREFMYATKHDLRQRQGPRILITAPRDHSTDIISVLTLYLAYVTHNSAAVILHQINNHEYFLGIWKNTISEEGLDLIQYLIDL